METFSRIVLYGQEREKEKESLQNSRTEPAGIDLTLKFSYHTVQSRMCSTAFYSMQIVL